MVDLKGRKSRKIVQDGVQILLNLEHRGACGAEKNTGDGAGILIQIPHTFLAAACAEAKGHITLPAEGQYGVGMVFLPSDPGSRAACEHLFEKVVRDEGQRVLGWREVPVDSRMLGPTARRSQPVIKQLFIARHPSVPDQDAFERKLYVIRRRARHAVRRLDIPEKAGFYISSLSSRTIVYKGMLNCDQLTAFYRDLQDDRVESALALVHSRFTTNTFPNWARAHPYRYDRAQRRDQHAARQRQLDARPREHVRLQAVRRRSAEDHAGHRHRTAATRRCSTTRSSCWCWPGARCRTP